MEITWYGHSCFRFMERGMASVVCDPYDHEEVGFSPLKLKADIITISHDKPGHNYVKAVKGGDPYLITGPGEYEIGGVFITAAATNGHNKKEELRNVLYLIDFNGITIAHLGAMTDVPSQKQIESLGTVNIALVPVGGSGGFTASKAAEVVNVLEPNIVIPMHYQIEGSKIKLDPISKFLKAMGISSSDPEPMLKISSPSSLPEETKVVVLENKGV